MATKVTGDQYKSITAKLFELGRQINQEKGYPFNPENLITHLQAGVEGKFHDEDIPILVPIARVEMPGVEQFHAREAFVNHQQNIKVFDGTFFRRPEDELFDVTETNTPATVLRVYHVNGYFQNPCVFSSLDDRPDMTLAHVWSLLNERGYFPRRRGVLVTNGYANIFYRVRIAGVRKIVRATWHGQDIGWYLCSELPVFPCGGDDGDRVFSR